jgi:ComF family protein
MFLTHYLMHSTRVNLLNNPKINKHLLTPNYANLIALSEYKWPVDKLILDLKFAQKVYCAHIIIDWFIKRVHPLCLESIEAIVPIPLSHLRYMRRQYNQAQILADLLGQHFSIPVINPLARVRHTQAQAKLNPEQRQSNLKGAFACVDELPYQHLALIDDVITTGATINQACSALQAKQADLQITVITMAISLTSDAKT